jgi:DNA-binding CsgD family transcriptional regulator
MSKLTDREREIIALLAQGKSCGIVAHQLVISRHTVYTHVKNIKQKVGVPTTRDMAMSLAMQMQRG